MPVQKTKQSSRLSFWSLVRSARRLPSSRRGVVLLETALAAPILLIALAGVTDLTLLISARLKLSSASNNLSTLAATGGRNLDEAEMTDILDNIGQVMAPITDFGTLGKATIAAVQSTGTNGATKVLWNRCTGNLDISNLTANQRALSGVVGSAYALPNDVNLDVGLTAAVVQVSYKYKPLFLGLFIDNAGQTITKTYVQRTRYGEFGGSVVNGDPTTAADDVPLRVCGSGISA